MNFSKQNKRGQGQRSGTRKDSAPDSAVSSVEEMDGSSEYVEKIVNIGRCAKVVKGGRRFSFTALVVVGDRKGKVGAGHGKAKEVPDAIRKAIDDAKGNMVEVQLRSNTIPHEVTSKSDGAKIILKPASPGTGVIAGPGARAVLEAVGVSDVLSKSLQSNNSTSVVHATIKALQTLRTGAQLRAIRRMKV